MQKNKFIKYLTIFARPKLGNCGLKVIGKSPLNAEFFTVANTLYYSIFSYFICKYVLEDFKFYLHVL